MGLNNLSSLPREHKITALLDYARECYKRGHKPTKKEIRRKFRVEIYNYFDGIADYHRKAGIEISLRNYPKESAQAIVIDYVKRSAENNVFPNRKEIEEKFKIHLRTYFNNLKDAYYCAKVDYSLVKIAIEKKILKAHTYHNFEICNQKKLIKDFIRKNVMRGIYPSIPYIQKSLNLSFYNLYDDIFQAYKAASVKYDRPSPILLGKKKEEVLTKIVKSLLIKMGFKIKRISIESDIDFNRSADMTVEDNEGRSYVVEIKAFREDYNISKRELWQLAKYIKREKVSFGIFFTTSASTRCKYGNIWFINGNFLTKLLEKYGLSNHIKKVEWIQKSRVNSIERRRHIQARKTEIFDYIKMKGSMPTKKEIQKILRIDIRSIFGRPKPYEKLLSEARIRCLPCMSLNT